MAISPSTSVSRTAQTSVAVPVEEAAVANAPSALDDPSSKVDSFHGPTGTVETGGVTFRVADGQVSTLDKDGTEVACGTCDDKGHYQVTLDGNSFSGDVGKLLDVRYVGTLSHGSKVDNLAAFAIRRRAAATRELASRAAGVTTPFSPRASGFRSMRAAAMIKFWQQAMGST